MSESFKLGEFIPKKPINQLAMSAWRISAFLAAAGFLVPHTIALLGFNLPWSTLLLEFTFHVSIAIAVSFLFWLVAELYTRTPGLALRALGLVVLLSISGGVAWARIGALPRLETAEKVYTAPFLVASLNVNVDNEKMREAAQWAVENRPDVMAFSEVSEHQLVALRKSLNHIYKYEYKTKTQGLFGMSVFSYYPIAGAQFINDDGTNQPMFAGKVLWDVEPVMLGVVHPMPPFTPELLAKRDSEILALAEGLGDGPAVLMGDFNATRASTLMPLLGKKFGYAKKTPFYTLKPYLLDIDHVLMSREHFLHTESNASIVEGSDHRLVWAMAILKSRNIPR